MKRARFVLGSLAGVAIGAIVAALVFSVYISPAGAAAGGGGTEVFHGQAPRGFPSGAVLRQVGDQ